MWTVQAAQLTGHPCQYLKGANFLQIAWTFLLSRAAASSGTTPEMVGASVPQQVVTNLPQGEDPAVASVELLEEIQEEKLVAA